MESCKMREIERERMSRFLFFFLLFILSLNICFSSAFRYQCHPEDAQILGEIFNTKPIVNCCRIHDVHCNINTSWVEILNIRESATFAQIPPALGKMTNLTALSLDHLPNLRGEISPEIAKLTKLTILSITWTNLTGPIPAWLSQLKELDTLHLSYNRFTGSIPPALADLPKMVWLRLDRNQLTGPIPDSFVRFTGTTLMLGHNQLSGTVPKSLGDVNFHTIELQANRLSGNPSHLFNNRTKTLGSIDLSRNLFDFDLTDVVFPVTLVSMDLSHNMIRGSIPLEIVDVINLVVFNVSYNRLCGRIPHGGPAQSLPGWSSWNFAHNKCLCGPPLSTSC